MLEKLLLAAAITFSLNLSLHIRGPSRTDAGTTLRQQTEVEQTFLVTIPEKLGVGSGEPVAGVGLRPGKLVNPKGE
jgi:hypothetical protein